MDAFPANFQLNVQKETQINAPAKIVFEAILEEIGPSACGHDGKPMQMKIEPWPGGRWLRDLGNNTGHLWGHVQVIKPPTLLEISGPLFMSYPVISHVQYRVTEKNGSCLLAFSHRALGEITSEHREGVNKGWDHFMNQIKKRAQK